MAGGRLGDIFGHRNVLLFGMTLFNIATLVCALVHDRIGLVVGRAFQGMSFSDYCCRMAQPTNRSSQ